MSTSSRARRALAVPSTLILTAAGIGVLLTLLAVSGVSQDAVLEQMRESQAPGDPDPEQILGGLRIAYGVMVLVQLFVVWGALQMRKARNYTASLAAAVLACLPIGSCCLLGLPAGVWAIVVMVRPEVKGVFFGDDEGPDSDEDELNWEA